MSYITIAANSPPYTNSCNNLQRQIFIHPAIYYSMLVYNTNTTYINAIASLISSQYCNMLCKYVHTYILVSLSVNLLT